MSFGLAHTELKNQVTTLTNFSARTHQGTSFNAKFVRLSLSPGSSVSVLSKINVLQSVHLVALFFCNGFSKLEIFENPVVGAGGPVITPSRYNRKSNYSAGSVFSSSPQILTDGDLIDTEFTLSGWGGSPNEWIIGPDQLFEFRLTNLSDLPKLAMFHFDFYEIGVKGAVLADARYVIDDYVDVGYVEGTI
jgi:hypothetical protein